MELFFEFLKNTGFGMLDMRYIIMICVGILFCYLAIAKDYEPLLMLPIGFGIIVGNLPFFKGFGLGIYENNSVLHYLYFGVTTGVYPSIVFLGLGAMTDFSSMLARPKLMLLGAAAQMGIYFTLLSALALGFAPKEAASVAIIGGVVGAIFGGVLALWGALLGGLLQGRAWFYYEQRRSTDEIRKRWIRAASETSR